jgi:hypothetical protein
MTPYSSTFPSSSGHDYDLNKSVPSTVSGASSQQKSENATVELNEGHEQASSLFRPVAMGKQRIALLSRPPNDPVLEEFAREYLPLFDENTENHLEIPDDMTSAHQGDRGEDLKPGSKREPALDRQL